MSNIKFPVNIKNALQFQNISVNNNNNLSKSLLVKRRREDPPVDELVIEQQKKKRKLNTIEDSFAGLSLLGKRKLYRLRETLPFDNNNNNNDDIMIVEPNLKKIKLDHNKSIGISPNGIITNNDDYVIDIYHIDETIEEDKLDKHPTVFFLESYIDDLHNGPEYDSDIDSEDSNDENYYANSYPEDLTSSCEQYSSDADDEAYFSDYDDFGELDY